MRGSSSTSRMSIDMLRILPDARHQSRAAVDGWLHGLGLRRRLLVSFAVGSLLLCAAAAGATWWLSAGYLQSQRTRVATAEGLTSALAVQQGLTDAVSVPGLLERTRPPRGRRCCTATASGSPARCPSPRRTYRRGARTLPRPAGRAVRQRAEVQGDPRLFVAVPVGYGNGGSGGAYVAVLPLTELDGTLKTLSAVLAGVALLTSVSFTVLEGWASRRRCARSSGSARRSRPSPRGTWTRACARRTRACVHSPRRST